MITIFSIPKPFEGHTGIIQRNAITSWTRLEPKCEVVLVGDEAGTSEIARELGIRHIPEIERNEFGTPLWNSYMDHGQDAASYPVVCWVPADTILLSDFLPAASAVIATG